jgi:phosphoglycolate phosphatase
VNAPVTLRRPRLVLFDLDGTLVDSVRDLEAAANATLEALARPPLAEARVRDFVGDGVDRLVHRCLTGEMDRDAPAPEFRRARETFMRHYEAHNARHSRLYDGVREGLDTACGWGAALGCVTNKPAHFTEPLLAHFGLLERFRVVVSGDSTPRRKPHPEPLLHAASTVGVAPARALMVGDSDNDVRAARAAGMPVVCVSYGYNRGRDIAASGPDAVVDSLARLADLFDGG